MIKNLVRLQKLISQCGYTSRRKAEKLITSGRVQVDGVIQKKLGIKVSSYSKIEIDDQVIKQNVKRVYYMLNKPSGFLCSKHDPFNKKLIYDLFDEKILKMGLFSVGRLDLSSEGLLLLTNDGLFANKISHPSGNILKKYEVTVNKNIPYKSIAAWKNGVYIKGVKYTVSDIKPISPAKAIITLNEGKNREIRKLFEHIKLDVKKLKRIAIGPLQLGNLPIGQYRELSDVEKKNLIETVEYGK